MNKPGDRPGHTTEHTTPGTLFDSTDQAMAGKSYSRGMRAHKITFQAMWQILLPELLSSLEEHDRDLKADVIRASANDDCDELCHCSEPPGFRIR